MAKVSAIGFMTVGVVLFSLAVQLSLGWLFVRFVDDNAGAALSLALGTALSIVLVFSRYGQAWETVDVLAALLGVIVLVYGAWLLIKFVSQKPAAEAEPVKKRKKRSS